MGRRDHVVVVVVVSVSIIGLCVVIGCGDGAGDGVVMLSGSCQEQTGELSRAVGLEAKLDRLDEGYRSVVDSTSAVWVVLA
jgi:hypothetical protein